MLKKLFFAICALLIAFNNWAQSPAWLWAQAGMGSGQSRALGASIDKLGNVYVIGFFTGNVQFGALSLNSSGGKDIFIAKYNGNGEIVWAKSAGGANDDEGSTISIDANGNIYVTGYFSDLALFENIMQSSFGREDAFVAKYDTQGQLLWVKNGGSIYGDKGRSVVVGNDGKIYVCGTFTDENSSPPLTAPAAFDNVSLMSAGASDIFIAVYDDNGSVLSAKRFGGAGYDNLNGMHVAPDGTVFLCGSYAYSIEFDTIKLNSISNGFIVLNGYTVKLDSGLNAIWAKNAGGRQVGANVGTVVGVDIKTDGVGNVYVLGGYNNCDLNLDNKVTLKKIADADIFLVKYDVNGSILWAKNCGGQSFDEGDAISIDANSNIYVAGSFNQQASFGNNSVNGVGSSDVFVAKYNKDGGVVWVAQAGGLAVEESYAVSVDVTGTVVCAGSFKSNSVDFGTNKISKGSGPENIFVAKLDRFPASVKEIEKDGSLDIFPNPVVNEFRFNNITSGRYTIYDLTGKSVKAGFVDGEPISIVDVPSGIYMLVVSSDFEIYKVKLVKE